MYYVYYIQCITIMTALGGPRRTHVQHNIIQCYSNPLEQNNKCINHYQDRVRLDTVNFLLGFVSTMTVFSFLHIISDIYIYNTETHWENKTFAFYFQIYIIYILYGTQNEINLLNDGGMFIALIYIQFFFSIHQLVWV